MGFLDKLKSIFFKQDYDKVLRNLTQRIDSLNIERTKANIRLERLSKNETKIPKFEVEYKVSALEFKTFTLPTFNPLPSMNGLKQKRTKQEAERRLQLERNAIKNLDLVKFFINCEEPESAEELLHTTSSILQELKSETLNELYNNLQSKINELKSYLRQREIERIEIEAKRKAEELKRQREQERLRKLREEEERLRKEQEAREYEEKLAREEQIRRNEIERLTAVVTRTKDDANKILQYLRMKGITRFYHFTDRQNLMKIKQYGGLYSWYYCEQNGIDIPNPGGDSDSRRYDRMHGLEDYVRLSFCNDHPMAWRKYQEGSKLLLLFVDIDVAGFKDTLFTDRNAASSSFSCGGAYDDLLNVNIQATQRNYVSRAEGEIFSQHQAECMIKTFIPIKYITNIDNPKSMIFQ